MYGSYLDGAELSSHFKIYIESARTKKGILDEEQQIERKKGQEVVVVSGYSYSKTPGEFEIPFSSRE